MGNICTNLFAALKVNLTGGVHQRRDPRQLVVGFYHVRERSSLLRQDTSRTAFENAEMCPDVTKMQRQEETALQQGEIWILRNKE
jgi:hypothetical protein